MEQELTFPLLKQLKAEGYTILVSNTCAGGDEACVFTPQRWDIEDFITGDPAKQHEDLELLIIDETLRECSVADLNGLKVAFNTTADTFGHGKN